MMVTVVVYNDDIEITSKTTICHVTGFWVWNCCIQFAIRIVSCTSCDNSHRSLRDTVAKYKGPSKPSSIKSSSISELVIKEQKCFDGDDDELITEVMKEVVWGKAVPCLQVILRLSWLRLPWLRLSWVWRRSHGTCLMSLEDHDGLINTYVLVMTYYITIVA